MIDANELARADAARELAELIDVRIYVRFVCGETIQEGADISKAIKHVDQILERYPSIPRITLWWVAGKATQVVKKCRDSCSELVKAGSPWHMAYPVWRATLAFGALTLLCFRVAFGPRTISSRCTLIPIAKYLYQ